MGTNRNKENKMLRNNFSEHFLIQTGSVAGSSQERAEAGAIADLLELAGGNAQGLEGQRALHGKISGWGAFTHIASQVAVTE